MTYLTARVISILSLDTISHWKVRCRTCEQKDEIDPNNRPPSSSTHPPRTMQREELLGDRGDADKALYVQTLLAVT